MTKGTLDIFFFFIDAIVASDDIFLVALGVMTSDGSLA